MVSSLVLHGTPDDAGRFCQRDPLANQAPGDVADGVGRANQRGEEQHGKQDDAGLSNHAVDATGQRASSPLMNGWQQSRN